jgi:FMN-dependent NADH-azoreductase
MAHLLHVDSSALTSGSVSKDVATTFRKAWQQAHPEATVTHRDLGLEPVPPLLEAGILGQVLPAEAQTPEQAEAFALRARLADELLEADAYLFSVPMYNWAVPSTFKAWLDQALVAGRTLDFQAPPLAGRPATVILSYGGGYDAGTPREGWDAVQPYLEIVLGKALGLDVTFIKTQLTLAERNPAMADLIPLAHQQREAAHVTADAHARTLAAALTG